MPTSKAWMVRDMSEVSFGFVFEDFNAIREMRRRSYLMGLIHSGAVRKGSNVR